MYLRRIRLWGAALAFSGDGAVLMIALPGAKVVNVAAKDLFDQAQMPRSQSHGLRFAGSNWSNCASRWLESRPFGVLP